MFHKISMKFVSPLIVLSVLLAGCAPSVVAEQVNTTAVVATTAASASDSAATETTTEVATDEVERPAGWSEETHSNDVDPNFDVIFPQDQVNELTMTITPETWEAMQANMTEIYGEPNPNRGQGGPGGGQGGNMPGGAPPEGFTPPAEGERAEGGPGGMQGYTREKPMWVTATIEFAGDTWTNVGIRYKGNSSLMSGWNSGSLKLPFKLDFDQFEDEYPEIDNQRFYGFKQLSLANGFSDNSFMRDAVTYDLLEEAGLVAAETAFYELFLDYGEGPVSLGLYTMIEVVDDTVIDRYFDDNDGNIYEGDGAAASLAEGTFDQIEGSFQKENNEEEADWSDIEKLYEVLNADLRTTDPEAWRASLESIFDVDSFLEWLAISAVIQHWDTYGSMTHNYYLYNNPETGLLTWISWDHNMTMSTGAMSTSEGGGMRPMDAPTTNEAAADNATTDEAAAQQQNRGPGRGMQRNVSLDKAEVTEQWPLIRYLLDEPTYYEKYIGYMEETANELFVPAEMAAKFEAIAAIIEPYASADVGAETFATAVQELIDYAQTRSDTVKSFLGEQ